MEEFKHENVTRDSTSCFNRCIVWVHKPYAAVQTNASRLGSIAPIALICTEADRLIMNRKRHYAINLWNSIAYAWE